MLKIDASRVVEFQIVTVIAALTLLLTPSSVYFTEILKSLVIYSE